MFEDFKLDKQGQIPYHYQVYNYLLDKIIAGELKEGVQIPNETELCRVFEVSRTTLREALRALGDKGHISRSRGQGTFILKKSMETTALQRFTGMSDELKASGADTSKKILIEKIMLPDEEVANKMEIDGGVKVIYIQRLILLDNEPLYITNAYFPNDIFKKIDRKYLKELSFTLLVSEYFKINVIKKKRIMEPDVPDEKTMEILKMGENDKKVISHLETYWYFDYNGRNRVIFFEELFKGDKSKFIFES
jgi:DNA-binding GntR family transcriptional regulator